jgi:hypothetical protein
VEKGMDRKREREIALFQFDLIRFFLCVPVFCLTTR